VCKSDIVQRQLCIETKGKHIKTSKYANIKRFTHFPWQSMLKDKEVWQVLWGKAVKEEGDGEEEKLYF
jgi:hypothetical protein